MGNISVVFSVTVKKEVNKSDEESLVSSRCRDINYTTNH